MTASSVLVTGANGLLGPYLAAAAGRLGRVVTSGRRGGDRPCDLADRAAARNMLGEIRPAIVLHAAGLTDVDACERDPLAADRANREAIANIAATAPDDARILYVSTDQVYPDTLGPHGEGEAAPINAYGRSKQAGERAALTRPGALVLRTNFFGPSRTPGRASLSDFFAARFAAGEPVTLFRDSLFSALHLATVAALVVDCIAAGLAGVYNLGSREGMSKHDFALALARRLDLSTECATPGDATDLPGRAPRPADLRLNVDAIEAALGRPMPTLAEEIAKL